VRRGIYQCLEHAVGRPNQRFLQTDLAPRAPAFGPRHRQLTWSTAEAQTVRGAGRKTLSGRCNGDCCIERRFSGGGILDTVPGSVRHRMGRPHTTGGATLSSAAARVHVEEFSPRLR